MSTTAVAVSRTISLPRFRTVADLQAYLGGIPVHRIRLDPPPGQGTEADLFRIHSEEGPICELIDGILVETVMATYESCLAGVLFYFLLLYLEDHDIGQVFGERGYLRLFPGRVRGPDVSFISCGRMPHRELPDEAIASLAPDLAVEIWSENNTVREMATKLQEYFHSGTRFPW